MKVDLALEKGLCKDLYYVVINDEYYICIDKKRWLDLAEYLKIEVKENDKKIKN